ncbi:MAG: hypothetical protein ACFFCW_24815 [Candidatus Hodarchaeota archaeon]
MSQLRDISIRLTAILLGVIFLCCTPVKASDDKPILLNLIREDGLEHFTGLCTSSAPRKVMCEFEGVRIVLPSSPTVKEMRSAFSELEKEAASADKEKMLKDFQEGCQGLLEIYQAEKAPRQQPSPHTKESLDVLRNKLSTICNRKPDSKEELIEATRDLLTAFSDWIGQAEKRCCGLFVQRWEMEFTRVSEHKWVNSPLPSGPCKIMKLYELEGDGTFKWTLTETRVSGDTESPLCKDLQEELMKPLRWLWNGPQYFHLPCDYIDWSKVTR